MLVNTQICGRGSQCHHGCGVNATLLLWQLAEFHSKILVSISSNWAASQACQYHLSALRHKFIENKRSRGIKLGKMYHFNEEAQEKTSLKQ